MSKNQQASKFSGGRETIALSSPPLMEVGDGAPTTLGKGSRVIFGTLFLHNTVNPDQVEREGSKKKEEKHVSACKALAGSGHQSYLTQPNLRSVSVRPDRRGPRRLTARLLPFFSPRPSMYIASASGWRVEGVYLSRSHSQHTPTRRIGRRPGKSHVRKRQHTKTSLSRLLTRDIQYAGWLPYF